MQTAYKEFEVYKGSQLLAIIEATDINEATTLASNLFVEPYTVCGVPRNIVPTHKFRGDDCSDCDAKNYS